jgi:hypothetical protein
MYSYSCIQLYTAYEYTRNLVPLLYIRIRARIPVRSFVAIVRHLVPSARMSRTLLLLGLAIAICVISPIESHYTPPSATAIAEPTSGRFAEIAGQLWRARLAEPQKSKKVAAILGRMQVGTEDLVHLVRDSRDPSPPLQTRTLCVVGADHLSLDMHLYLYYSCMNV